MPALSKTFPIDAPGGLKTSLGGYPAWQSRDMVNWVHHGPITPSFGKWMTTAEFVCQGCGGGLVILGSDKTREFNCGVESLRIVSNYDTTIMNTAKATDPTLPTT